MLLISVHADLVERSKAQHITQACSPEFYRVHSEDEASPAEEKSFQPLLPSFKDKNHTSDPGKGAPTDRTHSCGVQGTRTAVQIWEFSLPSLSKKPKPASYTHSWTRNCFISTLQPQQGMFSTGSPFQWSLSDSQGEQLHSWRGRDSRALPQETLASRVFTHPASTEHMDKTHWFKTMLEHIIYLRSELLNRVFCWKQTHFFKN